jgi:hypothetical protein
MGVKRTVLRLAAVATTAGVLVAAPQLASSAATRVAPTISIKARSELPKITGDVLVIYKSRKFGPAHVTGTVSGATSGQVLRLYARQFPFKKAAAPVGSPVTITGSPQPYSFLVKPTLATRYTAELFATSTSTTPLATSATDIVYVAANTAAHGPRPLHCSLGTCHQTWRLTTVVPASALRTEMHKRWFVYFGIRFSRTGSLLPKSLRLGAGHPVLSAPRRVNGHEYAVTLKFTFHVSGPYRYQFFPCQKDTEAKDGLNLPGHHGCGTLKVISRTRLYLG